MWGGDIDGGFHQGDGEVPETSEPMVTWVLGMKSFKGFSVPIVNLPKPHSLAGLSISRVPSYSGIRDS